jgi:hypothetical protein
MSAEPSPYRSSAAPPKKKRGKEGAPLVLPVGAGLLAVCTKCGTRKNLSWRSEALRYTDREQRLIAILTALVGVAFRQWHVVRLAVPVCGDCDARWDHAAAVRRRMIGGLVLLVAGPMLAGLLIPSIPLALFGVAMLLLAFPIAFVFQRVYVRPHHLWIAALSRDHVAVGGVCRKALRAHEDAGVSRAPAPSP